MIPRRPEASYVTCCMFLALCVTAAGAAERSPDEWKAIAAESKKTEQWEPIPPKSLPAAFAGGPPSDAVVLFDGRDHNQWVSAVNHSPARRPIRNGVLTVDKSFGDIETQLHFSSYQLHLEWRIPPNVTGEGQGRGNTGLFLASIEPGLGYEIQILDSWANETYGALHVS